MSLESVPTAERLKLPSMADRMVEAIREHEAQGHLVTGFFLMLRVKGPKEYDTHSIWDWPNPDELGGILLGKANQLVVRSTAPLEAPPKGET